MNKLLVFLFLVIVAVTSCKKDKTDDNTNTDDILAAKENAIANNLFDDVFKQVDNSARKTDDSVGGTKSQTDLLAQCATITITPFDTNFPKTITVDFGATNCLGYDLRNRRGVLVYTMSDWYHEPGCTLTVTTQNFYVDDYKVEGTKTVINQGLNANNNLTYSVSVSNGNITPPTGYGAPFSWNTSRVHEWIAGDNTLLWPWDDEYQVAGTANGVNSNGVAYTIVITDSLNIKLDCRWIRSGSLNLVVGSHPTITVNYGSGTCDANATATINGVVYNFVMN